jgi:RND superfamily putative drug exporter
VSVFHSIGVFAYRFRWAILLLWCMVLISSAFFAPGLSGQLKGGGFDGANSEAERVQDLMSNEFGLSPATLTVVFTGDGIPARSEEFQKAEENALAGVRKLDDVRQIISYADTEDSRFISEDGKKSYAVVTSNVSLDATRNVVDEVRSNVRSKKLETYVTGAPAVYQDLEEASNQDVKDAEKYAFPFAVIILIFAFGTLVAAGVPVLIGGASVVTALAALYFIAGIYDMSVFTLTLSTMLGLGLGIDYALFFVSRFREELEDYPTAEAVPRTVATAGRSIFFSGTAVLIGLSGLLFFPFMFMRSIGVAGVVVHTSTRHPWCSRIAGQQARRPAPQGWVGLGVLEPQRRGRDAPSSRRDLARGRDPRHPALPGRPHEGRHPRGDRPAARIRVPRRRRHPEEELRVRCTQPDGDRRHPGG